MSESKGSSKSAGEPSQVVLDSADDSQQGTPSASPSSDYSNLISTVDDLSPIPRERLSDPTLSSLPEASVIVPLRSQLESTGSLSDNAECVHEVESSAENADPSLDTKLTGSKETMVPATVEQIPKDSDSVSSVPHEIKLSEIQKPSESESSDCMIVKEICSGVDVTKKPDVSSSHVEVAKLIKCEQSVEKSPLGKSDESLEKIVKAEKDEILQPEFTQSSTDVTSESSESSLSETATKISTGDLEETSNLGSVSSEPALFSPSTTSSTEQPKGETKLTLKCCLETSSNENSTASGSSSGFGSQVSLKNTDSLEYVRRISSDNENKASKIEICPIEVCVLSDIQSGTADVSKFQMVEKLLDPEVSSSASPSLKDAKNLGRRPDFNEDSCLSPKKKMRYSSSEARSHFEWYKYDEFKMKCEELFYGIKSSIEELNRRDEGQGINEKNFLTENLSRLRHFYDELVRAKAFLLLKFSSEFTSVQIKKELEFCSSFDITNPYTVTELLVIETELKNDIPELKPESGLPIRWLEYMILVEFFFRKTNEIVRIIQSAEKGKKYHALNYSVLCSKLSHYFIAHINTLNSPENVAPQNDDAFRLRVLNSALKAIFKELKKFFDDYFSALQGIVKTEETIE